MAHINVSPTFDPLSKPLLYILTLCFCFHYLSHRVFQHLLKNGLIPTSTNRFVCCLDSIQGRLETKLVESTDTTTHLHNYIFVMDVFWADLYHDIGLPVIGLTGFTVRVSWLEFKCRNQNVHWKLNKGTQFTRGYYQEYCYILPKSWNTSTEKVSSEEKGNWERFTSYSRQTPSVHQGKCGNDLCMWSIEYEP